MMPNDIHSASRNGLASDFDPLHDEDELLHEDDQASDNEEMAFSLATIVFLVLCGLAVAYIFGSMMLAFCKGNF